MERKKRFPLPKLEHDRERQQIHSAVTEYLENGGTIRKLVPDNDSFKRSMQSCTERILIGTEFDDQF